MVHLKHTSPLFGARCERGVAVPTSRVGHGKRFEVSWRRGEAVEMFVVGAKTAFGYAPRPWFSTRTAPVRGDSLRWLARVVKENGLLVECARRIRRLCNGKLMIGVQQAVVTKIKVTSSGALIFEIPVCKPVKQGPEPSMVAEGAIIFAPALPLFLIGDSLEVVEQTGGLGHRDSDQQVWKVAYQSMVNT